MSVLPIGCATALLLVTILACGQQPLPRRPDIFLITIDTLRADHLGFYGYEKPTSPRMDRLAGESIVFEHCQSHASNTRPSIASLMTGFLPHETGMVSRARLSNSFETLAEILKQHEYTTRAVVSNWVLSPRARLTQGFDVYDVDMEEHEHNRKHWPERVATRTTDAAIVQLDAPRDGPLFLWVHYQDPHGPYTPPDGLERTFRDATPAQPLPLNPDLSGLGGIPSYQQLDGRRDFLDYVAAYDGEIRHMDAQLGRLLDALEERDLYDRSLLILTADHGEAMGERGLYFNHVGYLYDTLTHVPMLLRRGDQRTGRRDESCQLIDVVPTVLGVLGLDADPRLRGRSLFQLDEPAFPVYAQTYSSIDGEGIKYSLVDAGYRLIYTGAAKRVELFDLANDPGESNDLAADPAHQQRRAAMLASIKSIHADDRSPTEPSLPRALRRLQDEKRNDGSTDVTAEEEADAESSELSDEDRDKLRSLGYLE